MYTHGQRDNNARKKKQLVTISDENRCIICVADMVCIKKKDDTRGEKNVEFNADRKWVERKKNTEKKRGSITNN